MTWHGIFGHSFQCSFLDSWMASGGYRGSFLFFGQDGVGKATIAREFARKYYCQDQIEVGCRCQKCNLFLAGGNVDFCDIDAELVPVDQVRKAVEDSLIPPYGDKSKIFLFQNIDKAHWSIPSVLLKAVEESRKSVFILTAKSVDSVHSALASRCQKIGFSRLSREDLIKVADSLGLPKEGRGIAVELCGGVAAELSKFDQKMLERLAFVSKEMAKGIDKSDLISLIKMVDKASDEKLLIPVSSLLHLALGKALRCKAGVLDSKDPLVLKLSCFRKNVLLEVESWLDGYGQLEDLRALLDACLLRIARQ